MKAKPFEKPALHISLFIVPDVVAARICFLAKQPPQHH